MKFSGEVNVLCLGAVGLGSALLSIAERQKLFVKHRLDVRLVQVPGAQVPELTRQNSIGYIGAPAALKLAAAGTELKIIASFDCGRLSHQLVARPGLTKPEHLRGTRLGARVKGAAIWIHTVLALQQLGLEAEQDNITILEIGDPAQIIRALEAQLIDGAVLSRAQSRQLRRKGYSVLLDLHPAHLYGAQDAFVVATEFLRTHPDIAEGIIAAMIEAAALVLSPRERPAVLEIIKAELGVIDSVIAEEGLLELAQVIVRKPYPSIARLQNIQTFMARYDPRIRKLKIENLIDDRFVGKLDRTGVIDRVYGTF